MSDHGYRKSVTEKGGRNTGRTWTEDGKKQQAGLLVGLLRLSARPPGRSAVVSHPRGTSVPFSEQRAGGGCDSLRERGFSLERSCHLLTPR